MTCRPDSSGTALTLPSNSFLRAAMRWKSCSRKAFCCWACAREIRVVLAISASLGEATTCIWTHVLVAKSPSPRLAASKKAFCLGLKLKVCTTESMVLESCFIKNFMVAIARIVLPSSELRKSSEFCVVHQSPPPYFRILLENSSRNLAPCWNLISNQASSLRMIVLDVTVLNWQACLLLVHKHSGIQKMLRGLRI